MCCRREWIDEVFDEHRQRQYPRELLFSTVVELTTLVSLGLRPSLHAAARTMQALPVTLATLYDKVNRTEPAILRRGAGHDYPNGKAHLGVVQKVPFAGNTEYR